MIFEQRKVEFAKEQYMKKPYLFECTKYNCDRIFTKNITYTDYIANTKKYYCPSCLDKIKQDFAFAQSLRRPRL
jgi:hypothetical protein